MHATTPRQYPCIIPFKPKPNLTIPNQIKCPLLIHNFVDFPVVSQARSSKFCMQLQLGNTHTLYNSKPNQTRSNHIKPNQITINWAYLSCFSNQELMELYLDDIHAPYHSKPNQNNPDLTIPNQISLNCP